MSISWAMWEGHLPRRAFSSFEYEKAQKPMKGGRKHFRSEQLPRLEATQRNKGNAAGRSGMGWGGIRLVEILSTKEQTTEDMG